MRPAYFIPLVYLGILVAIPSVALFVMAEERSALCSVLREQSAVPPVLRGQTCEQISASEYMCAFEFTFRGDDARAVYEGYAKDMETCSAQGEFATVSAQNAVNHPDSFEQTIFDIYEGPQASVSLKDKGALQKTYVFVRLPVN